ncbi:hypothetical protein DRJ12_01230 [Candidatus Acetothermia bacterium]|nr:MAG: hypothetical protein DRJ12_01230 [Candidatus Acetothermia bacterium]
MVKGEFDELLRDALRNEVKDAAGSLQGLEARITSELEGRLPRLRPSDWLRQLLAPTRAGRIGQLAVIGATAAAFLVLGIFLAHEIIPVLGPERLSPSLSASANREVLFVVPALDAKQVAVVGDFNGWEATPLSDDNHDGIWTANIPLSPGRYEYAFIIDGRWWGQDPLADEYVSSFGQYSSVRYIGGGGDGA